MMRPRTSIALLAGVLLAGLIAVPGAPAGAQDITDLPRLGFEIDPTQGSVGDLVEAWVDTDDVAEHCLSREGFLEGAPFFQTGALMDFFIVFEAWYQAVESGDHPSPGGLTQQEFDDATLAMFFLLFAVVFEEEAADGLYEALFVLTFVDPVSQEMLGDTGNFSPSTGEGEIVVPPLDPTLYALAAACVTFAPQEELLAVGGLLDQAAIALHDWLSVEWPDGPPPPSFPPSDELVEFLVDGAPVWVPVVVEPMAIGVEFYCVLQPDGFCATPPGPVGLIDDAVLEEFNSDGPGDDALAPEAEALEDLDDVRELIAVEAAPSFTG